MHKRFRAGTLLAAAFALSIVTPLQATTITSTSVAGWLGTLSAGSAQDVAFNPNPNGDYSTAAGYTASGFTFTGPDGAGYYLKGIYSGANSLKAGNDSSAQLMINTPAGGETGLLFAFTSSPGTSGYTLTLSDGEVFNLASGANIFGISVSHAITSATFTVDPGSQIILQAMSYGTTSQTLDAGGSGSGSGTDPSATPEASTMLLLASGLLLFAKFRRNLFSLTA